MARATKISKTYDKSKIFETLNKLELSQNKHNILTHFDGRLISNTIVTDRYELFDFPTFAKDIIGS